jgi:formate dehydrogenase maturation protein FdhE
VNEYYKINTKYRKSPEAKLKKKMYEMKVKYNLTPEEYAEIITKQGNKCAICGDIPKKMCIDHDHNTGKVRGMLCSTCNLAIGLIRDCPIRLEKAIAYLS